MQGIVFHISNCYGIGLFQHDFGFTEKPIHAVYAPNGFMKTSFARCLLDLQNGVASTDQMFPARVSERDVNNVDGSPVQPSQVLVIRPYVDDHEAAQMSTLLVEPSLRKAYEEAISEVSGLKTRLLKALAERAGLGKKFDPEVELCAAIGVSELLDGLEEMEEMALKANEAILESVQYRTVFGDRAWEFLASSDIISQLEAYVRQYDALVSKSPILTRQFTHTQANALHKSLSDSQFFEANHWMVLSDDGAELIVREPSAFKERVELELKRVLDDASLRTMFDAIDRKLSGQVDLRALRDFLREHPEILPKLANMKSFRKQVWGALLSKERTSLEALKTQFSKSRIVIENAIRAAQEQSTEWEEVVHRFNERFHVPFRLKIENQADVILKEEAPRVVFEFRDQDGVVEVGNDEIKRVLSQGERRALYLLQVLFELRIRENEGSPTLLVIDDIADSFDYRNKYAIIEYLSDIVSGGAFRLIVLSHNYDFHRSVASRLGLPRVNRWFAVREGRIVKLVTEKYQKKNPLTLWRDKPDNVILYLASIPLVRNLAEYCGRDDVYEALTEVLHIKSRTKDLTFSELDLELAKIVKFRSPTEPCRSTRVWDALMETAETVALETAEYADLEYKIVLSIAIRLLAEEHMIGQLGDAGTSATIGRNQTRVLLDEYRAARPDSLNQLEVLDRVQLMTPENIHVNSFMYEPILDLGMSELRELYSSVRSLQ